MVLTAAAAMLTDVLLLRLGLIFATRTPPGVFRPPAGLEVSTMEFHKLKNKSSRAGVSIYLFMSSFWIQY